MSLLLLFNQAVDFVFGLAKYKYKADKRIYNYEANERDYVYKADKRVYNFEAEIE